MGLPKVDIVILSEACTKKDSKVDIDNFTCFNFYGKFKHRKAKCNCGEIVIYVRNSIKPGISIIENHFDIIIWLKLNEQFHNFTQDLFLAGAYMWGDDSPAVRFIKSDLFNLLEQDVFKIWSLVSIHITEDWNCRVGNKADFVKYDKSIRH